MFKFAIVNIGDSAQAPEQGLAHRLLSRKPLPMRFSATRHVEAAVACEEAHDPVDIVDVECRGKTFELLQDLRGLIHVSISSSLRSRRGVVVLRRPMSGNSRHRSDRCPRNRYPTAGPPPLPGSTDDRRFG